MIPSEARTGDLLDPELDFRCINAIRFLAADAVQEANSGHPGLPMGAAPIAYVLWQRHLKHDPRDPSWPDRDRFVLSAGHGSMLLYSLLHLTGYDLPLEELKNFRQWGSRTPGHPENFHTPGVETTTGPLGQGFANGVGMAIAERILADEFNRPGHTIVDHHTYGIVSDGDLMEGISHEAASLAGHLGLGKLIYLYDDNNISIDGSTDLSFTEDVVARFRAYGWHVLVVDDGNDVDAVDEAIYASRMELDRPSLIAVKTIIGYGSPNKQNTADAHGSPLGPEELALSKNNLGWPESPRFYVPDEVYAHMSQSVARGAAARQEWRARLETYSREHEHDSSKLKEWLSGRTPAAIDAVVPQFEEGSSMATRASSGQVLNEIVKAMPQLIGGSADLTGSNKTAVSGREGFQKHAPSGRYLFFGVREHAMASICSGLSLHGSLRPYCGTFLVFSDYMRPAMRLAAMMGLPVVYVLTHDSIGLGEDGPTHQPIEHLMALRAIPNLTVIRPADANETAESWLAALRNVTGPTVLALSRQNVPTLKMTTGGRAAGLQRGAYVLVDTEGLPDAIILASGSEVQLAVEAGERLARSGKRVRVVSVPCWELFEAESADYRESVLPPTVTARVSIEAGVTGGWERFVGRRGLRIGIDRFGASAPYERIYEEFGLTADRVVAAVDSLLQA